MYRLVKVELETGAKRGVIATAGQNTLKKMTATTLYVVGAKGLETMYFVEMK